MRETASVVVARAIAGSRLPLPELARRTGTNVTTLSRFMKGQASLTLATFELLAAELNLRVGATKRRRPRKSSTR